MSKPRFSLYAEIDTLAHANTIRNSIVNQLSGKEIFEDYGINVYVEDSKNVLSAGWQFNNSLDRDDIRDWARDQIENHPQVKAWVLSASLSSHSCTHSDSDVKNCRSQDYFEWSK